jgi:hypothetical protein
MRYLYLFCWLVFIFVLDDVAGQSMNDLSRRQITRINENAEGWFPHTEIILRDSQKIHGTIIQVNDSGLVWVNGSFSTQIQESPGFIPASQIKSYHIRKPYQLGPKVLNGAMTASWLTGSLVHSFYDDIMSDSGYGSGDFFGIVFGYSAILGAGIGVLNSLSRRRDFQRTRQLHPYFSRRDLLGLNRGALFFPWQYQKLTLQTDYLSSELNERIFLKKLQPRHQGFKLEIALSAGHANLFHIRRSRDLNPRVSIPVNISGAESYYLTYGYSGGRPNFSDIGLFYRLKPWLKLGLQTMKTESTTGDRRLINDHIDSHLRVILKHRQTWGLVAEVTPFPTYFLRLRRWDFNAGAGVFVEPVRFEHDISGYSTQTATTQYFYHQDEERFVLPAFLGYGALTWRAFPWLAFQTRVGHYHVKKIVSNGFELPLDFDAPAVSFKGVPLHLSRQYYSFGLIVSI